MDIHIALGPRSWVSPEALPTRKRASANCRRMPVHLASARMRRPFNARSATHPAPSAHRLDPRPLVLTPGTLMGSHCTLTDSHRRLLACADASSHRRPLHQTGRWRVSGDYYHEFTAPKMSNDRLPRRMRDLRSGGCDVSLSDSHVSVPLSVRASMCHHRRGTTRQVP